MSAGANNLKHGFNLPYLKNYGHVLSVTTSVLEERLKGAEVITAPCVKRLAKSLFQLGRVYYPIKRKYLFQSLASFVGISVTRSTISDIAYLFTGNLARLRYGPVYKCTMGGDVVDKSSIVAIDHMEYVQGDFLVEFRILSGSHAGDVIQRQLDYRRVFSLALCLGFTKYRGKLRYYEPLDLLGAVGICCAQRSPYKCIISNIRASSMTKRFLLWKQEAEGDIDYADNPSAPDTTLLA